MLERLMEINRQLKRLNYVDISCDAGLMAERSMLFMLDADLPRNFSLGLD